MKILVTGGSGLLGSTFNNHNVVKISSKDFDLKDNKQVEIMFQIVRPDAVIHTAAICGGLQFNANEPSRIFYENTLINTNVIHFAHKYNVKKLLAVSSVCAFNEKLETLKEEDLQKDEPNKFEYSYGQSKRVMDLQIQSLIKQGTKNYCSVISTNLFGPQDHYSIQNGHVLPSLIHKIYLAKKNNTPFYVWGNDDHSVKREFLYSEDMRDILLQILNLDEIPSRILVSSDKETSIKQVVEYLCEIANFEGEIIWQSNKPVGQKSRRTDLTILNSLVKVKYTDMKEALRKSYNWFVDNYEKARK